MLKYIKRLEAVVEDLRNVSTSTDVQTYQRRLLIELCEVQRQLDLYFFQDIDTKQIPDEKLKINLSKEQSTQLFQLVLRSIYVYSGNDAAAPGSVSSTSRSTNTSIPMALSNLRGCNSECMQDLVCNILVLLYDYSVASIIGEAIASKNTSIHVKTVIIDVISRLPPDTTAEFVPDCIAFVNKHIKTTESNLKSSLLESVNRLIDHVNISRLVSYHTEVMKIITKTYQDKYPEVRIASATLLRTIALHSPASVALGGNNHGSMDGNGSSQNTHGNNNASGVSFEGIMQLSLKGIDDGAPDARRAFAEVAGVILSKYASTADNTSADSTAFGTEGTEGSTQANTSNDMEGGANTMTKSKLPFKLRNVHVPGMSNITLTGPLSRRKQVVVKCSSVASTINYFKDLITTKFISPTNPHHGGILASYSIALVSMFHHLPPDSIMEREMLEVLDATMSILDIPFPLSDLARGKNAVLFVLRHGLAMHVSERECNTLLGVYTQKLQNNSENVVSDVNHHKLLVVLVELSHLIQAVGEGCVPFADKISEVLQQLLSFEKHSVRFQAAVALASLTTALPYYFDNVIRACVLDLQLVTDILTSNTSSLNSKELLRSISSMDDDNGGTVEEKSGSTNKVHLYKLQGRSAAIVHLLRSSRLYKNNGVSHSFLSQIADNAERLTQSQFKEKCPDSVWLTCTRAGWSLLNAIITLSDKSWMEKYTDQLIEMWLKSSILHSRESSLELLRIEAVVATLHSYLCNISLIMREGIQTVIAHILHVFLAASQDVLSKPMKRRGQVARYRLLTWILKCFTVLDCDYSDSYILLLDVIAELTTSQSLSQQVVAGLQPQESTFLDQTLSKDDEVLEMINLARLITGDSPDAMYPRELNHILTLLQPENTLTDSEVELQYQDIFWTQLGERTSDLQSLSNNTMCSSLIYVRLVDASVILMGKLYHFVPEELQQRCLQHLSSVLSDEQVDCNTNICSILYSIILQCKNNMLSIDSSHVLKPTSNNWYSQVQPMLFDLISDENSTVRRGAAEATGLLASIMDETGCNIFVQELQKRLSADKTSSSNSNGVGLASNSSVMTSGAAFALACIKRSCGSRVSIDTGLIFWYGGEVTQPLRTWILHSWSIIVESVNATGGDYDQYIKSTLSLINAHLISGFCYSKTNRQWLRWNIGAKVAIAKIMNGVVSTLGPELASNDNGDQSSTPSIERVKEFRTIWALLRQTSSKDARLELEYIKYLEELVIFAPNCINSTDIDYIIHVTTDKENMLPVFPNGGCMSVLRRVGMSCLRTLCERDSSLISEKNLLCELFHILNVEYKSSYWNYLPNVHALWDSFSSPMSLSTSFGARDISNSILALIDIDAGSRPGAKPCLWALICRGISVGDTGITRENDEEFDFPKSPRDQEEDIGSKSDTNQAADETSLALSMQLSRWRLTKQQSSVYLSTFPIDSCTRPIRQFAAKCVLRIFDLLRSHVSGTKSRSLDISQMQSYFKGLSASGNNLESVNYEDFLCLYLDEFVAFACQISSNSIDGSNPQVYQSIGLKLLNVLLDEFALVRDPAVLTVDAYVLDASQAQILSALRQGIKLAMPMVESKESTVIHPNLLRHSLGIAGNAIQTRLIQDKFGLQRILRMVLRNDYSYDNVFLDCESFRTSISINNIACIAKLFISCIKRREEQKQDDLLEGFVECISSSQVHVLVTAWLQAIKSYGILLFADQLSSFNLPLENATETLRIQYKRIWLVVLEACMYSLQIWKDIEHSSTQAFLLRFIIVYLKSHKHEHGNADSLVPLVRVIHVSIKNLSGNISNDNFVLFYHIFEIMIDMCDGSIKQHQGSSIQPHSSSRSKEPFAHSTHYPENLQIEAIKALSQCLEKGIISELLHQLGDNSKDMWRMIAIVRDGCMSPFRLMKHILDNSALFENISETYLTAIVQSASGSLILLHTTENLALRSGILDVSKILVSCIESSELSESHNLAMRNAIISLSRATHESLVALLKLTIDDVKHQEQIMQTIANRYSRLIHLLQNEVRRCVGDESSGNGLLFVIDILQTNINSAPGVNPQLDQITLKFHCNIIRATKDGMDHLNSQSSREAIIRGYLLEGMYKLAEKLVQVNDQRNAQTYFAEVCGHIFQSLVTNNKIDTSTQEAMILFQHQTNFLKLISDQLDNQAGKDFMLITIPILSSIIEANNNQIEIIIGQLLLYFAQTKSVSFKEVVLQLSPNSRNTLETALRNALSPGKPDIANTIGVKSKKLDLSRFN